MKRANVLNFTQFLVNLKLNKFDKETRAAIISNSLIANKVTKEFNESIDEARKRYYEGIETEINDLANYRKKFASASSEEKIEIEKDCIANCSNALAAEQEFTEFVNKLGNENVDYTFTKINRDSFVDQCAEADIDITVNTLELLNELFN